MESITTLIIGGLGGVIAIFIKSFLDQNQQVRLQEFDFKQTRYKCIVILMQARLTWQENKEQLQRHRPDLPTLDHLKSELNIELMNGLLFASDEVITALSSFIEEPTFSTYVTTAFAMRKDLYKKSSKFNEDTFKAILRN